MAAFELGTDGPTLILVGVDGSPTSLRAGAYAAGLARRQHCRLLVVHVVPPVGVAGFVPGAMGVVGDTITEVSEELRRSVEDAARQFGIDTEFRIERGDAYSVLVRIAEDVRADAVVVGASAGAGHRVVGSIALRLVRAGRWPVTVVP